MAWLCSVNGARLLDEWGLVAQHADEEVCRPNSYLILSSYGPNLAVKHLIYCNTFSKVCDIREAAPYETKGQHSMLSTPALPWAGCWGSTCSRHNSRSLVHGCSIHLWAVHLIRPAEHCEATRTAGSSSAAPDCAIHRRAYMLHAATGQD